MERMFPLRLKNKKRNNSKQEKVGQARILLKIIWASAKLNDDSPCEIIRDHNDGTMGPLISKLARGEEVETQALAKRKILVNLARKCITASTQYATDVSSRDVEEGICKRLNREFIEEENTIENTGKNVHHMLYLQR